MSYATKQNMIDRFGEQELIELTDRDNLGLINNTVMEQAIGDAQAVIDGYLRSAYTLPLATVPAELVRVCCDLARFHLFGDRVPDTVQKRRDEAVSWLRDVAAKRVSLGLDAAGQDMPAAVGGVNYKTSAQVFNNAAMAGY